MEEIEIYLTLGYEINPNLLKKMKSLRWIHIFQTGLDHLSITNILEQDILLTHTRDIHGTPISEYVLSMILYKVRDFPRFVANKNENYWDENEPFIEEANGKTVAIFGMGSIGQEIARILKYLNLRVIGVNTNGNCKPFFDEAYTLDDKVLLLAKSDFVVLIFLQQMKPTIA